jgi:hypothetical protein
MESTGFHNTPALIFAERQTKIISEVKFSIRFDQVNV